MEGDLYPVRVTEDGSLRCHTCWVRFGEVVLNAAGKRVGVQLDRGWTDPPAQDRKGYEERGGVYRLNRDNLKRFTSIRDSATLWSWRARPKPGTEKRTPRDVQLPVLIECPAGHGIHMIDTASLGIVADQPPPGATDDVVYRGMWGRVASRRMDDDQDRET